MTFKNEEEFRSWLIEELENILDRERWLILKSKNVTDIIISKQDDESPALLFIEVKYYKKNYRRIGIGTSNGEGFQPEILMKEPIYIEKHMMWVLCNEDEKCLFLSNDDIRNNCAGGSIDLGKQNNISNNVFDNNKSKLINIRNIPKEIKNWIEKF